MKDGELVEMLHHDLRSVTANLIEITERLYEAEKLIVTIAMYSRIGHTNPRDYNELCQDHLKKYMQNSSECKK